MKQQREYWQVQEAKRQRRQAIMIGSLVLFFILSAVLLAS